METTEAMGGTKQNGMLAINDRVKRKGGKGCFGIVKEIRQEVTASSELREPGLSIGVQWDNGTYSFFSVEGLEVAK